ncbi:JmjC domain protein, partial [Cooperia oncophora]
HLAVRVRSDISIISVSSHCLYFSFISGFANDSIEPNHASSEQTSKINQITKSEKKFPKRALRELLSFQRFTQKYGDAFFKCGETPKGRPVHLKFKYFAEYMRENEDDSPLYIFDDHFAERKETKGILEDYEVPRYFSDDLFNILGTNVKRAPYRWIVIGPARSGTTIHVDPLGTSAWNALIHGHKRWVFIHPDTPKELVHIPKDQRGVHPKEAVTWFSTVYKRIRQGDWPFEKYPVFECRQNPGETLFVPCVTKTSFHQGIKPLFMCIPTIRRTLNEQRPELLATVYQSLLDSKPIEDGYLSDNSEPRQKNEDERDSTSTADSTDLSGSDSESEAAEEEDDDEDISDV